MPTSIPYDPSLALGNLIPPGRIDTLVQISNLQAPIETAQETLNSYIELKRSLDMTIRELVDLKVDTKHLVDKMTEVDANITVAAEAYAETRLDMETKIQPLRAKLGTVSQSFESPIDYNRTQIKSMPLSADSLKMDVQYFQFDKNEQSTAQTFSAIKSFVTQAVGEWGEGESSNAADTAIKQINTQRQNHDIQGTLIIAVSCTHRNAQLLAPFVLDPDKAIRVWNAMYPGARMDVGNVALMQKIAAEPDRPEKLNLLSGATFGSSFVGMVHLLRREATTDSQAMQDKADMAQFQANVSLLGMSFAGGIGVDSDTTKDVKNLLSSVSVDSHVSLITRGVIPSIKANDLAYAVYAFADDDWKNMGQKLQNLQNQTQTELQTTAASAAAARTGQTMVALEGAKMTNALTALSTIEGQKNKVLDINSLMTAFENYVDRITGTGDNKDPVGVPITYYVKELQRSQLAQMWGNKYYPGKYVGLSSDDAGTGRNAEGAAAGAAAAPAADGGSGGSN
ncbi:hypothetical protein [Caldimonas sp. KR1-144]|uniref:hypothetical protein n=1 Tax=Caldimonas sp. KR1-144 TaxID=3400911 RepID=UPI003C064E94